MTLPKDDAPIDSVRSDGWPYNQSSWNPLTDWADHYVKIFDDDAWRASSEFDIIDVANGQISRRHIGHGDDIDAVIAEEPDVRIYFCDSTRCEDGVTRASFAANDVRAICSKHGFHVTFLDFFVGRNRTITDAWKRYEDKSDPETMTSYDMWYILPVRIIEREATYYDSHFMLFTVYAHYDCLTKKLVLFYIHRTGSESARAASRSSDIVKDCLENDLKYVMARGDDGLTMLRSSPFAIQMPTIIAAVVFWTDALHKERIDMWAKEDKARKNLEEVDTVKFHDVARYAHSYKTNTEFTRRVIEFVIGQHDWFAAHIGGKTGYSPRSPLYTHMSERLKTQLWQMKMSERYSDEAVARSDVMLSLYFNKMAELNSLATSNIAASTRKDAGSMGIIAFLGMIFLPLAAVSAFFSMAFFPTLPMKLIWLYPLCSLIFTFILIGLYTWWDGRRRDKNDVEWQAEWQTMKVRHGSCSAPPPTPPPEVAAQDTEASPMTSLQSSLFGKEPMTFASRVPAPAPASSRSSTTLDPFQDRKPKRAFVPHRHRPRMRLHLPTVSGAVI